MEAMVTLTMDNDSMGDIRELLSTGPRFQGTPARRRNLSSVCEGLYESPLARPPCKDPEEGLDVGIGADIAVVVEIR